MSSPSPSYPRSVGSSQHPAGCRGNPRLPALRLDPRWKIHNRPASHRASDERAAPGRRAKVRVKNIEPACPSDSIGPDKAESLRSQRRIGALDATCKSALTIDAVFDLSKDRQHFLKLRFVLGERILFGRATAQDRKSGLHPAAGLFFIPENFQRTRRYNFRTWVFQ